MDKPVITAQKLAELYPASHKAASEKMTPEEYATFTDEAAEINARLEAQENGNKKLNEDLSAANDAQKASADENTLLKSDKVTLQKEIDRLKPFESKLLEISSKGKGKPGEDSNSRNQQEPLPANHPNSVALATWRAANPNAK